MFGENKRKEEGCMKGSDVPINAIPFNEHHAVMSAVCGFYRGDD